MLANSIPIPTIAKSRDMLSISWTASSFLRGLNVYQEERTKKKKRLARKESFEKDCFNVSR